MNLRSRIMIVTFLIILFVQGLNCFLEVGFLANNLEEANLRKYSIVGNQMMRKIDTSLMFGKPLSAINHHRLLSNILPRDVENIYIIDRDGHNLYTAKNSGTHVPFKVHRALFNEKNPEIYRLFFPLTNRAGIQGKLVIEVSNQQVKEKRLALVRKSVLNFIIILACSLPVLYLLLTLFINRPYNRFVQAINTWLGQEEWSKLKAHRIDLSPLVESRAKVQSIKAAQWLVPDLPDAGGPDTDRTLYEKLKDILQINIRD